MKKLFILIFTILFATILFAQNPVPNPSFENWSFDGSANDWTNSIGDSVTMPGHSGYYAMKGTITPEYLDCQINSVKFPVYGFYPALRFYYKFVPVSGADEFQVSVAIADSANTVVAIGEHTISYVTDSFVEEILGITRTFTGGTPMQAAINFSIKSMSINGPTVGTYLIVDDVEMYDPDMITGVSSIKKDNLLQVYPSPANNYFEVKLPEGSTSFTIAKLYDMWGNQVSSQSVSNGTAKLDVNTIPAGNYLLVAGLYSQKIQVTH